MDFANTLPAFYLSLKVAFTATGINIILGITIGFLLARKRFPGRELLDTVLTLPMVLPPTVMGYYLLVLLGKRGVIGQWLESALDIRLIFTWQGAAIAAAAAALLPAVAAYHLGDALQAASLFALRSYRITTLPFVIYAVLLWGLGLPAGHALAFTGLGPWPAWRSPLAFWCAIALAQGLAGLTLAATLWRAALKKR